MKLAKVHLTSTSVYSQSRHYEVDKERSETHEDYDLRTWRHRMHVNEEGYVYIPPMAFKNCLSESAQYLQIKIPGKRGATFKAKFESGILIADPLVLPIKAMDVAKERLFVPADGRRGGSTRVWRNFPIIPSWSGVLLVYVLDEIINQEIFTEHITWAGRVIGIGRFRPAKNGFYGRFKVDRIEWLDVALDAAA